ncbi:MAG: MFS transporter [Acidobacteria bacterium]|nr:MFS transporter [Acidobacteriota bacterium]
MHPDNPSNKISKDPREILNNAPMGRLQLFIIALTLGLNAMDGIDVLSIGLAAPAINKQWPGSEFLVGWTLTMECIGMGIGSLLLGWIADMVGRRKVMFLSMAMMAVGMFMATTSGNIYQLWAWRIFTGLGIGGLLSAITALTAEFSNLKNRALCIFIMGIGYPIGGIVGSLIAGWLLGTYGNWHLIFYFGAALTVCFIPLFYFIMPESVHWLVRKQPAGALDKVNGIMKRLGHNPVAALPEVKVEVSKKSIGDLFAPRLRGITAIIAAAYFLQIFTYYFVLKWVPKVIFNMGFTQSEGAGVLMYANIGGVLGGILLGLLALRLSVKKLTIAVLTLSGVCFIILGQAPADLTYFAFLAAFCGFFGNAGIIGLYALFPAAFPTHVRASGTGFVLSVGRIGAGTSPPFVGFLFDLGLTLPSVLLIISLGTFIGAGVLSFLKLKKVE